MLAWKEKIVKHLVGECLSPFTVLASDESRKLVYIQDEQIDAARPFNAVLVKRYLTAAKHSVSVVCPLTMQLGGALSDFGTRSADA